MVLESLAAGILSKYLGEYVSGFQKENLKFSVLAGEAVLENLQLKKEALDKFQLPITVKAGNIFRKMVNEKISITNRLSQDFWVN
jgi:vacuolar protein sorting-associated protein 13A/C